MIAGSEHGVEPIAEQLSAVPRGAGHRAERVLALGWGTTRHGDLAKPWLNPQFPSLTLGFDDWFRGGRIEAREVVLWSSAVHLLSRLFGVERVLLVQPAVAMQDGGVLRRVFAMRDRLEARDSSVFRSFAREARLESPAAEQFLEQALTIERSCLVEGLEQLTNPFIWEDRWSRMCTVVVSRGDRICSSAGIHRFFASRGCRGIRCVEGGIHGPGDAAVDAIVRGFWS